LGSWWATSSQAAKGLGSCCKGSSAGRKPRWLLIWIARDDDDIHIVPYPAWRPGCNAETWPDSWVIHTIIASANLQATNFSIVRGEIVSHDGYLAPCSAARTLPAVQASRHPQCELDSFCELALNSRGSHPRFWSAELQEPCNIAVAACYNLLQLSEFIDIPPPSLYYRIQLVKSVSW